MRTAFFQAGTSLASSKAEVFVNDHLASRAFVELTSARRLRCDVDEIWSSTPTKYKLLEVRSEKTPGLHLDAARAARLRYIVRYTIQGAIRRNYIDIFCLPLDRVVVQVAFQTFEFPPTADKETRVLERIQRRIEET